MNEPQRYVLVVDDDPDFAAYLKTIFEGEGFEVTTACDGEEALWRVRETRPDLVTLDVQMPRRSGVLFYREMKSNEGLRSIPVIVVTGLRRMSESGGPFVERFFEVGRHDLPQPEAYLDKPIERKVLLATLRTLTDRRETALRPTTWMGLHVG